MMEKKPQAPLILHLNTKAKCLLFCTNISLLSCPLITLFDI